MSNDQKMISIEPIPLTKLTVVINNFVANTITHLNKLSVKGEEKLSEFDNKLNDLDAMTTLLEAKLKSLPENITSTYPPLEPVNLDDIIPIEPIQVIPKEEHQDEDDDNQQSQKLFGANQYMCIRCKKLVDAETSNKIIQAPIKLILNIDYGKDKKYKVEKLIFPNELDITPFLSFNFKSSLLLPFLCVVSFFMFSSSPLNSS